MESKKQNNDGLESKDAHVERPLITYDKLKEVISDTLYKENIKTPIFQDDTDSYTLEELYKLRDKGVRCGFRIGGMWTGIGGAIAYREALQSYIGSESLKNYKEHREKEEAKMWTPEQKQAILDKSERYDEEGKFRKIRKGGNNRKQTKGRKRK